VWIAKGEPPSGERSPRLFGQQVTDLKMCRGRFGDSRGHFAGRHGDHDRTGSLERGIELGVSEVADIKNPTIASYYDVLGRYSQMQGIGELTVSMTIGISICIMRR